MSASTATAQTASYVKFTPPVVVPGQTTSVLIEVEVSGTPTQVTLQPGSGGVVTTAIPLKDDGTGGDRVAGDHIYSGQIPAATIVAGQRADDVHRVFLGFLNLFAGSLYNMFIDVYGTEMGTYPITRLSQFVQATPNLVNIEDAAYFVNGDPTHVTRQFYQVFGDDFDQIDLIFSPEHFANRNHVTVRNDVQGIGESIVNATAQYGSAGRLIGISNFPIPGFYDGAENGYIHELGHTWINFLNFPPVAASMPHWPYSSMAGGVMGYSQQGAEGSEYPCIVADNNGVVTLTPRVGGPVYGDFDLYLMGLIPPEQVRTQVVFIGTPPPCSGTFTGAVTRLTANDIISHYGPRLPAVGSAPASFRIGTILVTRDELATPEMMWMYSWFTDRAELKTPAAVHSGFVKETDQPFYMATGGRGTLNVQLPDLTQPDFTIAASPNAFSVTAGAPATFNVSVTARGTSFDSPVTFGCTSVPAHASCAFSAPQATPGANGATVMLTINTADATASMPIGMGAVLFVISGWTALHRRPRSLRPARVAPIVLVSGIFVLGCGSNGSSPPPATTPTPAPTPSPGPATVTSGTYAITVTGTSGSSQHAAVVTLTVH
jgi:hypothetical protein